jgi:hypothetical protein
MGPFRRRYEVMHFGLRMLHLLTQFGRLRNGYIHWVTGDIFTIFSEFKQSLSLADIPIHTHTVRYATSMKRHPSFFCGISKMAHILYPG